MTTIYGAVGVLTIITPQLSHRFTWMAMFNRGQRMCKEHKTQV